MIKRRKFTDVYKEEREICMEQSMRYTDRRIKRRRRRVRAVKRTIILFGMLGALILIFYEMAKSSHVKGRETDDMPVKSYWMEAQAPVRHELAEIYEKLDELAATDKTAAKINEERAQFPEKLLAAYVNNTEMAEFMLGYTTADFESTGELSDMEKQERYPLLLQWDKRWGYAPYGESIIALSGCGPVCLSMVVVTLTGNTEWTPARVAQFSEEKGYYVTGVGTAWSLMKEGAQQLGVTARELSLSESAMQEVLDEGGAIICTLRPGDFTTEGHFIVIRGYDETGFLVNDPNCIARSSMTWSFDKLYGQIKNLWAYTV